MQKSFIALFLALALLMTSGVAFATSSLDLSSMTQSELRSLIDQARLELLKYDAAIQGARVLFDHDGAKVTLQGITYVDDSIKVGFIFENNSSVPCGVQIAKAYINGWETSRGQLTAINPGKKAKKTVTFYDVSECDVLAATDVQDIEFTMYSFNGDSYKTIFTADPVTIDCNPAQQE